MIKFIMNNKVMYGSILFALFFLHSSSFTIAGPPLATAEEFEYIERSPRGPSRWGDLKTEWATCKTGKMQSPINIPDEIVTKITKPSPLKLDNYKPCNAKIKNLGHVMEVEWMGDAGSIQVNGTNYLLRSCHWHISSEHAINGQRFSMELHVVHQSPNVPNERAVVGILYQLGQPDPFISKLTESLTALTKKREEKNVGVLDPKEILGDCTSFYRYMGSLTTPPCTEGVIWTVQKKVRTAAVDQINLLLNAVNKNHKMNARPLQAANGRDIHLYNSVNEQQSTMSKSQTKKIHVVQI